MIVPGNPFTSSIVDALLSNNYHCAHSSLRPTLKGFKWHC